MSSSIITIIINSLGLLLIYIFPQVIFDLKSEEEHPKMRLKYSVISGILALIIIILSIRTGDYYAIIFWFPIPCVCLLIYIINIISDINKSEKRMDDIQYNRTIQNKEGAEKEI